MRMIFRMRVAFVRITFHMWVAFVRVVPHEDDFA